MTGSDSLAIGVDIGGTGIKAALVDVVSGTLVSSRLKTPTPAGGEPEDIIGAAAELIRELDSPDMPVGVAFPSAIRGGRTLSAANVSSRWVGLAAEEMFEGALQRSIVFINDADAAGIAEHRFGAAGDQAGLVIVTTLGTGIGSAFVFDGVLQPNTELGHLLWEGQPAEHLLSARARERRGLDWPTWGRELGGYYRHLETLFHPELFVISGGVSKSPELFVPHIEVDTPVRVAQLQNNAGIIGAASLGAEGHRRTV